MRLRINLTRRAWAATFAAAAVLGALAAPARAQSDLRLDPAKVLGPESCGECHKAELEIWRKTHHFSTFQALPRSDKARTIADKMGIKRIKDESACLKCHFTVKEVDGKNDAIAGISCESCHGAAKDWLNIHNDYKFGGASFTKDNEPVEHRKQRLEAAEKAGMIRPVFTPEKFGAARSTDLYAIAQNCYSCHLVPNEELVNKGGHSAGTTGFELVTYSQGEILHNVWYTEGKNHPASPEHRRMLFVMGKLLEVEYGLRGVAKATAKDVYATTMAKRTQAAIETLKKIQAKVSLPEIADAVKAADEAGLKLNNEAQLTAAADKVQAAARKFQTATDGSKLAAVDDMIPTETKGKAQP